MGPAPVAVEVDLDLLRSAPWRLEAPTPDGSVLVAERSVFEDRGGGDLMWSGGQPGAGYDTVVLTVEGGRLVGRFGAAGGGAYGIHAERDGRGGIASIFGAPEAGWCGVDSNAEDAHEGHVHGSARADAGVAPPTPVSNPQSHDRLDILVAYTETAARNWADRGGPEAAIRHAGDYMKMVFRNNGFEIEPRIVHVARASAALDRAGRDLGRLKGRPLHFSDVIEDGEMLRLRHEHRADLVHLFTGEAPHLLKACGRHPVLQKVSATAADFFDSAYGWTSNHGLCGDYAAIFVHEVGHGLGANHEPASAGIPPERRIRPYAAGHVNYDIVPAIGTAMAYGGQIEPFFSTTRFGLYGAALGVAGERDNARTLRETLHIAVRYSDYLPSLEGLPAPPSDLRVRYEGGAAHLSWRDNAPDADGYELEYRYHRYLAPCCDSGVVRLWGRTEASIPLEHTSPGSWYRFQLRARKGKARSLRSGIVELFVPGEPPAVPSDFSVTADEYSNVHFRWTDNSDNEAGFDLWILLNGEPVERYLLPPDSEHAERSFTVVFGGGAVGRLLPEPGVDYGARVFAYDSSGQASGSEELTFRWEHPLVTGPVADVSAFPIAPTTVRVTWTVDPEAWRYSIGYLTQSTGSELDTRWQPGIGDAVTTGAVTTGWVDIDGLARGDRYTFEVAPKVREKRSGLSTYAYLTMGERGRGPQAPSELSGSEIWRNGNKIRVRLSWEDHSTDELGFVVQEGFPGREFWYQREVGWHAGQPIFLVPANTTSAEVHGNFDSVLRVFAFNERGYSLSSPRLDKRPEIDLAATAGDTMVGLNWGVEFRWGIGGDVTVTGMQVRWKAAAGPPFDGSGATWVNLPAWARGHTVTGLRNGTEYTFAVRAVTNEGVGLTWTGTATPRRGLPLPRQPAGSCRGDAQTLCLRDSRFEAKAYWRSADGGSGAARVVNEGTDESGIFEFFGPENWEILLKVLDGCETNGHVWVLGASTTNLGYRIEVTDTVTGESKRYENEPGQPAPAIIDTEAFSRICGGSAGGR